MKYKAEFNVTQKIPHDVKNNIQQVGLEYVLFSQIKNIKITVFFEVDKSSKAKPKTIKVKKETSHQ